MNNRLFLYNLRQPLKNKWTWILSTLFVILSIVIELVSFINFFNDYKTIASGFSTFNSFFSVKNIFDLIFLGILIIYLTVLLFLIDKENGKLSLEIKGGISWKFIFLQRISTFIIYLLSILSIFIILESLIAISIIKNYKEAALKIFKTFPFLFLYSIIVFSLTLVLILFINKKISLPVISFFITLLSLSPIIGISNYDKTNKIYEVMGKYSGLKRYHNYDKNMKMDENFKNIDKSFYKIYSSTKTDDATALLTGNYHYLVEKTDIFKDEQSLVELIKHFDKVFENNISSFKKYDSQSNDHKIKRSYIYKMNILFMKSSEVNDNYLYNLIKKVSDLNKEPKYDLFLKTLEDFSLEFLKFFDSISFSSIDISRVRLENFINENENDQKSFLNDSDNYYKTVDQIDFYWFLSLIYFEMYSIAKTNLSNLVLDDGFQENLSELKKQANYNPFNQLSSLQFGDYKEDNSDVYYKTFGKSVYQSSLPILIIPNSIKYYKVASKPENSNISFDDIEEVEVTITNYVETYLVYLLLFILLIAPSYLSFRRYLVSQ